MGTPATERMKAYRARLRSRGLRRVSFDCAPETASAIEALRAAGGLGVEAAIKQALEAVTLLQEARERIELLEGLIELAGAGEEGNVVTVEPPAKIEPSAVEVGNVVTVEVGNVVTVEVGNVVTKGPFPLALWSRALELKAEGIKAEVAREKLIVEFGSAPAAGNLFTRAKKKLSEVRE